MARRILQNITVETRGDGQPAEFVWRDRLYRVAGLIEHWKESGSWWDGEPERDVFRVVDASGRIFELHRLQHALLPLESDPGGSGGWLLWGIED